MPQRAVWRTVPDDPSSMVGLLLADRNRYLRSPLRTVGCLTLVGTVYFLFQGELLPAFVLCGTAMLLPRLRMPVGRVDSLLTLPLPAPAYPCSVDITLEGTTIGWDRGIVTFVDGWLHFEGHRTSFSVSRSDVVRRKENAIEFNEGGVAFYPDDRLSHPSLEQVGLEARFASQLDQWYRIESAAKGISVLPPVSLHPTGVARAWSDLLASIFRTVIAFALFWAIWAVLNTVFAFFVLGLSSDSFGSVANFRKIRKLRRKQETKHLANVSEPSISP